MNTPSTSERQGIQSIEIGIRLLNALASTAHPMMLREVAKAADMPAAKAHRYMVSFLKTGMVEQDSKTARYDLGPLAMRLGLAKMARQDPIRLADPILESLCESIRETVALAIWGSHGPTIVRIFDSGNPVTVTLRPGTVLPIYSSATGRAFAAFGHLPFIKTFLNEEIRTAADTNKKSVTLIRRQLEKALEEIRQRGLARATGSLTPGINGFSAPVFGQHGQMVAAITSLGAVGEFDATWDSALAKSILAAATNLSTQLGHTGHPPPRRS